MLPSQKIHFSTIDWRDVFFSNISTNRTKVTMSRSYEGQVPDGAVEVALLDEFRRFFVSARLAADVRDDQRIFLTHTHHPSPLLACSKENENKIKLNNHLFIPLF